MKKTLMSLAMTAALGMVANTVAANEVFVIDEGSVPGTPTSTVTADLINGIYSEILTIYANPDVTGPPLLFSTFAYADLSQYALDGTVQTAYLGNSPSADQYKMYSLFSATGYISGSNTFVGLTGTAQLWIDPLSDTDKTFGADGFTPVTIGDGVDDYLIASTSSFESGFGIFANNTGAFDLYFTDFLLTTGDNSAFFAGVQNGDLFFTNPRPFHVRVNMDGDFNEPTFAPGTEVLRGDVSVIFVPEPGSLALLGLGLAGLGLMQRRRKAVK